MASNGILAVTEDAAAATVLGAIDVAGDAATFGLMSARTRGDMIITNAATRANIYRPTASPATPSSTTPWACRSHIRRAARAARDSVPLRASCIRYQ